MAAAKASYVIVWKKTSQVYSTANLNTAVQTPIPKGCTIEDKQILFMSYSPDTEEICLYEVSDEEIETAEKQIKEKKKENVNDKE